MADLEISEELKKIIANQFGIPQEDIDDEAELDADLGITDLELDDFIEQVEAKFDLSIPAETYHHFKKVSDIASYIWENAESPA